VAGLQCQRTEFYYFKALGYCRKWSLNGVAGPLDESIELVPVDSAPGKLRAGNHLAERDVYTIAPLPQIDQAPSWA
jgi:hypothetical protein